MKFLFIILILFSCSNIFCEESKPQSLENLWIQAQKHSPGLKARLKKIQAIQLSIDALPIWYKPNVYADLGYSGAINQKTNQQGPLARLVAEWVLWDGGRTHYSRLMNQKMAASQKWQQIVLTMNLKKSIASIYYKTARLETLQNHYNNSFKHYKRLERLLRPRLRIGKIGLSDLKNIQIHLSQLQNKQTNTQATSILLKQQLFLLVGRDDLKKLVVPSLSKIANLGKASKQQKLDFDSLPSYKLAQAKIKSLEAQLQLAKRNLYWPSFGIETYGGYGPHIDAIDRNKPEVGIGLRFRIPLYSTRDRGSSLASKKAEIEAARLDLQQSLIQEKMNYSLKTGNIIKNRIQLKNLKQIVKNSSNNLNLSYVEFSRGLKSNTDMLTAIQTYSDANIEYINLKTMQMDTLAELYLFTKYSDKKNLKPKTDK